MNFIDHLRQFFDTEVDDAELRALAVHAIAADVRRLKPAISQAVWDARQQTATGAGASVSPERLNEARQLHGMYLSALNEFRQITKNWLVSTGREGPTISSHHPGAGSVGEELA